MKSLKDIPKKETNQSAFLKLGLSLLLFIAQSTLFAQNHNVTGSVVDSDSSEPLPFVNVILCSVDDDTKQIGCYTNDQGQFSIKDIPDGTYDITFTSIGYTPKRIAEVKVKSGNQDLGTSELTPSAEKLEEVKVTGTVAAMSYKVDRKVIRADAFPEATSALDMLESVPSLQVDVKGDITYRGDGTFKVFINDQPAKNGQEKLKTLSVDQIERVEVITNPPAKYGAEGTAGIILVRLKKSRLEGYSLSIASYVSNNGTKDIYLQVEKQEENKSWYINGYFGEGDYAPVKNNQIQTVEGEGTTIFDLEEGEGVKSTNINFGFTYDISDKTMIDISGYIDPFGKDFTQDADGVVTEHGLDGEENTYHYTRSYVVDYGYMGLTGKLKHHFKKDTSNLSLYIDYAKCIYPSEEVGLTKQVYANRTDRQLNKQVEKDELLINVKLDYENKITKNTTFAFGGDIAIDHIPSIETENGTVNEQGNLTPFGQGLTNQHLDFQSDVYAGYGQWKSCIGKLEYQLGVRAELTDRAYNYSANGNEAKKNTISYVDWFPSAHFLYTATGEHQLALNYSRRIARPVYWKLLPMVQYIDPYNYEVGNPELNPTFTNAYEFSYNKAWGSDFVGIEIFARETENVVQEYARVKSGNALETSFENTGTSMSIGTEVSTSVKLWKWWKSFLSLTMYNYELHTQFEEIDTKESQFQSAANFNNTFYLPASFTLKCNTKYNSPMLTSQVEKDGYYTLDLSMQKKFLNDRWSATVGYKNALNSIEYSKTQKGDGFIIKADYKQEPFAFVKLAYTFDNQK